MKHTKKLINKLKYPLEADGWLQGDLCPPLCDEASHCLLAVAGKIEVVAVSMLSSVEVYMLEAALAAIILVDEASNITFVQKNV